MLEQARNEILEAARATIDKGQFSSQEILAVMSHAVGGMLALQDQRTASVNEMMEMILDNIEAGNRQIVDDLNSLDGRMH